jgi:hypothetical protein
MEALLGLTVLYGIGWAVYRSIKASVQTVRGLAARRRTAAVQQRTVQGQAAQAAQQHAQHNRLSREMQLAILNLDREPDPDFRRAATAAKAARPVPVEWRRRQYHRLRPLLVQHYQRCLQRDADPEVLSESLTELIEALGLEAYEADYIRQEAERGRSRRRPQTGADTAQEFQARLVQIQQEHTRRMEIIRGMTALADDVRQQLQEAEERRFQEQLFGRERELEMR